MPHIDITMYPGRSEELKAELAKNVRDCAAETLKMDTFTKSPIIDSGKATFEVAFV